MISQDRQKNASAPLRGATQKWYPVKCHMMLAKATLILCVMLYISNISQENTWRQAAYPDQTFQAHLAITGKTHN